MAGPRRVDFNELVHRPGLKLGVQIESPESPEELASRLRREEADARVSRTKDLMISGGFLGLVLLVALCLLWVAVRPATTPDDKKWAMAILSAIVSGGVGYLTGKASK